MCFSQVNISNCLVFSASGVQNLDQENSNSLINQASVFSNILYGSGEFENIASIEIIRIHFNNDSILVDLKCTGYIRGYYIDPNSTAEDNYVPPSAVTDEICLIYTP